MAGTGRRPTGKYGGRSAQERRAERRQRLLDAGLELFGAGPGYRGTSVSALCEEAGLSTRQFYEEFRNLEEVLAALHLMVNDWSEQATVEALAGMKGLRGIGLEARATRLFRAYAAAVTTDPRRMRIAFVEVVGVSPELEEQRLARRARWVALIRAQAEAAASRGKAAERDYHVAATAFIGAVNGLLHDWSAGRVDATRDQVVDELVLMLLGLLRPTGWRPNSGEGA